MGRETKRVRLDFDWPMGEGWEGFLNPHWRKCEACKGSGDTVAHKRLGDIVSLLMISGSDAATGKCHPYFDVHSFQASYGQPPSPEFAELTHGLAGRGPSGLMGHDACDRWTATKKIIEAAGLDPEKWGLCEICGGHGDDPATREASEAWEKTEPPKGDGWQLWETVSEGSPVSPVFATPEELADWLVTPGNDTSVTEGTTREQWLKMIKAGWAPSMVLSEKGMQSGVAFVGDE